MGFGIKELVIILAIVILLFGTKKLKNMGADLGGALKGFRKSMNDHDNEEVQQPKSIDQQENNAIDGQAEEIKDKQQK